ncbi:hypothetical protein JHK85_007437 [Glycine max]|nr:hypothetical protein JHK85_007437 [Glycine max]KAG5072013.1 hypothetical protein JHK86_007224 [Glycine max]
MALSCSKGVGGSRNSRVCAASNAPAPLAGVIFEPFQELKKDYLAVPIAHSAINEQIKVPTSRSFCTTSSDRDSIEYDVVIIGAGLACLSAAIRLKQMCRQRNADLSVCVLEKGMIWLPSYVLDKAYDSKIHIQIQILK